MGFSAFERLLAPERLRQRAARAGFATPAMQEIDWPGARVPLLATNMRGTFLPTRPSRVGTIRYGFSACPVDEEGPLLRELCRVLLEVIHVNRCTSIQAAIERMRSQGLEPKSLVMAEAQLPEILGPSADIEAAKRSMSLLGYVTLMDGMQILIADLPSGTALVGASPWQLGRYTRVGDHVGILLQGVDRSLMVVGRELVG